MLGEDVMWQRKRTYLAVNLILGAFLFLSVSFNKEHLRPACSGIPILDILTGSYSNFMAAYVVSLFAATAVLSKRLTDTRSLRIVVAAAVAVFLILTVEELAPVLGASKVCDGYDIVASMLGSSLAVFTFLLLRQAIARAKSRVEAEKRVELSRRQ